MKLFVAAILFFVGSTNIIAQAIPKTAVAKAGKDHLFWYRGTKQNDSVLLTSSGWKITYKRSQNALEVKTGTQSNKFQKIATELARSKNSKIEMVRRIAGDKPDPSDLPTIRLVIAAVDDIEKQYQSVLSNSITLPPAPKTAGQLTARSQGRGPSRTIEDDVDTWQDIYSRVNTAIKNLKKVDDVALGVPPDFDVSICYYCDTVAKKRFNKQEAEYLQTIKSDEEPIVQDIFRIFNVFQNMVGENEEYSPEIKAINDELVVDLALMQDRVTQKMQRLVRLYKHDFLKIGNLLPLILGINRQCQLMGLGTFPEDLELGNIMTAADVEAYINKLIAEEDYDRVLNIAWILSTERQFQLLGLPGFMQGATFKKVLDFNRFKLTVSADAKVESDDYFKKGQVKSEPAYYKAIPTKDCKFTFIQSNGIKSMGVGNPFINFNLLQAESSEGTYIGNKKWVMIDPCIKVGFCGSEDTLRLFVIMPSLQEPFETWQTDRGPDHLPEVTNLFSDAFENNNNMVDAGDEMLEKMQTIQKFTAGLSTPEEIILNPMELSRGYFIVESIKENMALNALTLVPVTAQNKSTILFDKLYNGKPSSANENITYANMWVKLEHVKN